MSEETRPSKIDMQGEKALPIEWSCTPEVLANMKTVIAMSGTTHGLAANVPIICKAEDCPYAKACWALPQGLTKRGQRCPVEVSKVMQKFELYKSELTGEVTNVDLGLIKELCDIEIQLDRASMKLAIDGDFIQDVTAFVTDDGEPISQPQLHKATEYQDKLWKRKNDILGLLHLTRKDKAGDKLTIQMDPSTYTAQLLKKKKELEAQNIIEGDFKVAD